MISSADFWDQDVSTLRKIMQLDNCSVQEIALFRACNEWAERSCRKSGLPANQENKRDALGLQTLQLIRFPVMSVDEFQWEVVPTGMLAYQDVQSLLQSLCCRGVSFGSRYNNKPRSIRASKNEKSLFLEQPEGSVFAPDKPVYSCVEDDPLDCMLGAELLRAFLKQTVDDQAGRQPGSNPSEAPSSPSASRARLPPLTPRGGAAPPGGREPTAPDSPRRAGPGRPRKAQFEMVMGSRIDTEESQDGIVVHGGGKRPEPNDFMRLAPGFYRFRDEFLIETWLREGEAMVTHHGAYDANPGSVYIYQWPSDATTARSRLGIPYGTAELKGGVPLVSFLCRQ